MSYVRPIYPLYPLNTYIPSLPSQHVYTLSTLSTRIYPLYLNISEKLDRFHQRRYNETLIVNNHLHLSCILLPYMPLLLLLLLEPSFTTTTTSISTTYIYCMICSFELITVSSTVTSVL